MFLGDDGHDVVTMSDGFAWSEYEAETTIVAPAGEQVVDGDGKARRFLLIKVYRTIYVVLARRLWRRPDELQKSCLLRTLWRMRDAMTTARTLR